MSDSMGLRGVLEMFEYDLVGRFDARRLDYDYHLSKWMQYPGGIIRSFLPFALIHAL